MAPCLALDFAIFASWTEGNGTHQQRGVPIHVGLFAQPGWTSGPGGAVLEAFSDSCIGLMGEWRHDGTEQVSKLYVLFIGWVRARRGPPFYNTKMAREPNKTSYAFFARSPPE